MFLRPARKHPSRRYIKRLSATLRSQRLCVSKSHPEFIAETQSRRRHREFEGIVMKKFLLILGFVLTIASYSNAAPRTLDIYFIDVEGGASTLIVTPLGESMLIDSGFPE